jgi:type I restriction enzyme S subunit
MAVVTTTRSDILREYLTLFVSSKKDYIKETCRGTTVPHVSPDAISNMELAIPPLPEQKRIVDLISSIDSYIVALEQHVASARKLRMTILETKLDELSKLYGSVPLSSVCGNSKQSIVDGPFGSRLQRRDYLKEGIPVLKLQNIKEGFILKKNMDYVSESKYKELIRHSFLVGDLVITKLGDPLGVSSIVSDIEKGLIVADLVRIRPESIDAKFLCMQINSNAIKYHLNRLQKGSTRPRINLGMVRDLPIVSPPKDQALQCTTLISSFDDLIKATEDSLLKQKQLRSGLLADLLSGQHLIPESYDKVMGVAV